MVFFPRMQPPASVLFHCAGTLLFCFGFLLCRIAAEVDVFFWLGDGAQYPVLFDRIARFTMGTITPSSNLLV